MTISPPPAIVVDEVLKQALVNHQSGRMREAARGYQAILQVQPNHAEANHNLGILAGQVGQAAAGLAYLKAAIDSNPAKEQYWLSYATALLGSGQGAHALELIKSAKRRGLDTPAIQALAGKAEAAARQKRTDRASPTDAECNQLAVLFNSGQHAQMESRTRIFLSQYPDCGFLWKALGAALQMQGKDALPALQKAAEFLPDDEEAHNNLGLILQGRNQLEASVTSFQRALVLNPKFAEAHSNLGNALYGLGRRDAAIASYQRALQIKPERAEWHCNLGNMLQELGQLDGALASYQRALQIKPDYVKVLNNLGNVLKKQKNPDAAAATFRRALVINPDYAETHNNLGNALQDMEQLNAAMASYGQALALMPDYAEAHSNLGNTLQELGQLEKAIASHRRAVECKPDYDRMHSNLLFALNYHPDMSGEEIFEAYREFDKQIGTPHRSEWKPHDNSRDLKRRLRVGYVSPDFFRHSVRHFLEPLLAAHSKDQVETYAYSDAILEDEVTQRYKGYADHWVPTAWLTDPALAERIRADGIDILVDLAGHTARNRLGVFARKPAPVSLSWLGYGYTTGLTAIDYLLTDSVSAPIGSEHLFSEAPWRLTTPNYVYRPAEGMGLTNSLPALQSGYVTFGTLSRAVRINYRTIRTWSEILRRVENSRLVIDSGNFKDPTTQLWLAEQFAAHGIDRDRLEIGCHSPPWDVLRSLDIGLDCFPHNSGTTLFETLYMGLPFVTLRGRPSVGRIGSAILEAAGHREWIAETEEEYVEKAVALASDLPRLATLRSGLRAEMKASPMMDEDGFARKIEQAYREMFKIWAESNS